MEKTTIDATRNIQVADLKEAALLPGPWLTTFAPLQPAPNMSWQDATRLKSAANSAQTQLRERGMKPEQIREFLEPLAHIDSDSWDTGRESVVLLRSNDHFKYFQVRTALKESAIVADQPQVLPYLEVVQKENWQFYVLALSQKHVRLLRCTNHSSDEVSLGDKTPESMEQWLTTRPPTASHNAGESRGSFTSTSDRDNLDQHLANFFCRIDAAIAERLRGEVAPLIVVGVEHEFALWKDVSSYPHLVDEFVHGSPESLKGGELHARAQEIADKAFCEPMRKALERLQNHVAGERISTKLKEIVKASGQGRIGQLFVGRDARSLGDQTLNLAALQTLASGGEVWFTEPESVPGGGACAALLRY